jgi:hypothetical protein
MRDYLFILMVVSLALLVASPLFAIADYVLWKRRRRAALKEKQG